ncbi:MAG: glycosyltransferase [archaeon]
MIVTIITYTSIYLGIVATTFYILSFLINKDNKKPLFTDKELPFLTIIIPAYNEEKSIKRTIETALASDYPKNKFEIIVVDDGSKDNTLKIARSMQNKFVKVFTKVNGGKASALNLAISKARGEVIITMDADTFIEKNSAIEMIRYFKDREVMSVTPSIILHEPKGILQRVQQMEYVLGIFLRKVFASLNSIHVTPGAFSAYRKSFFDKYGGYIGMESGNLTEDLEMALRIQSHGYKIENSVNSAVYTVAPNKFKALTVQRRRWYMGLLKNMWTYKRLFGPKYGDLGMVLLPLAWISIFFSVFALFYLGYSIVAQGLQEFALLNSVNFDLSYRYGLLFNPAMWQEVTSRNLFVIFSRPQIIFLVFFVFLTAFYLIYASKKIGRIKGAWLSLPLFYIFFAVFFAFWWAVSIVYSIFNIKGKWR